MPNIKSAKKRVLVNEKSKAINKAYKSELATGLKKYNNAVKAGDVEAVKALLPVTVSLVDESVTRGIIHKNKADRKKADINAKYNALAAAVKPAKAAKKVVEKKVEEVAPETAVEEVKPVKKTTRKKAETTTKTEEKPKAKRTTKKKAE